MDTRNTIVEHGGQPAPQFFFVAVFVKPYVLPNKM